MREVELSDMNKKKAKPKKVVASPKKKDITTKPEVKKKPKKKESNIPKRKKIDTIAAKKSTKKGLTTLENDALIQAGTLEVERLQADSFENNREQIDQYVLMFQRLVSIARIAEEKYFKDNHSKDIYALMKVYDQLREVIADMRALQDISEYVESLDVEVLQPYVQQTAQSLVDLIRSTSQFADSRLEVEDANALKTYLKSKGKTSGVNIDTAYRNALDNARKILAG